MDINALHRIADAGDKSAEDELFRLLTERFEQFANRRIWDEEDARDVAQEALMTVAKEYKSIDFDTSFLAWAYKVLDNRVLSYIKKKRQRGDRVVTVADVGQVGDISMDPDLDLRSRLLDCLKKVAKINRRHARIIDLHYQGYKTDEICDRLSLTTNGFYIVLHRARKMLETCLETGEVK